MNGYRFLPHFLWCAFGSLPRKGYVLAIIGLPIILLLGPLAANAEVEAPSLDASAQQVMQAVWDNSRVHAQQKSDLELQIFDAKGDSKTRSMTVKQKDFKNGKIKTLLQLYSPSDLKDISLLSETNEKKNRPSQWIYLPNIRKIRRLSTGDQNKSFLGSDLTRRDLAGRTVNSDTHDLISREADGWWIRHSPKDKSDSYSKIESFIERETLVVRTSTFYDKNGDRLKELKNEELSLVEGVYMPVLTTVVNFQRNGRTVLQRSKIDVKSDIGKNEVGLRALQRR